MSRQLYDEENPEQNRNRPEPLETRADDWFWVTGRSRPRRNIAGNLDHRTLLSSSELLTVREWLGQHDPYQVLSNVRRNPGERTINAPDDSELHAIAHRFKCSCRVRRAEREIFGDEDIF